MVRHQRSKIRKNKIFRFPWRSFRQTKIYWWEIFGIYQFVSFQLIAKHKTCCLGHTSHIDFYFTRLNWDDKQEFLITVRMELCGILWSVLYQCRPFAFCVRNTETQRNSWHRIMTESLLIRHIEQLHHSSPMAYKLSACRDMSEVWAFVVSMNTWWHQSSCQDMLFQ